VAYNHAAELDVSPHGLAVEAPDRATLSSRFPQLGLYSTSNSLELPGELLTGDAIDDLLDIATDLADALSELREAGSVEATWAFRFGYETHWGAHLHGLRLHLYNLLHRA
jgi:hypothetical protein